MYRLTREQKYRDYAWALVQSIREHCRNKPGVDRYPGSYSTVKDVTKVPAERSLYQSVDLLSITLKYLYLIFADEDQMPLDQWVFSATGQPLPVLGKNSAYPLPKNSNQKEPSDPKDSSGPIQTNSKDTSQVVAASEVKENSIPSYSQQTGELTKDAAISSAALETSPMPLSLPVEEPKVDKASH